MTRAALLASLLIGLTAAPVAAQRTVTVDDSIAILPGAPPGPLSFGTGDGFGGMLGAASGRTVAMAWDTDVLGRVGLQIRNATCTGPDDVIVIYLDTVGGRGFADTTMFSDTFSLEARAVSATPIGADLRFPTGFEAEYAIAVRNEAGGPVAFLYELVAAGGHVATPLTVFQPGGFCGDLRLGGFGLPDLGMAPGDDMLWFATLLNGNNGFRSNELHGVASPPVNIGTNPFALRDDDYNVFTSVGEVMINELDSDTPGTDIAEFIELIGPPDARLDGAVLVGFNGSAAMDASYFTLDLSGRRVGADGFFVAGNPGVSGVDLTFPNNTIQNGADAVGLYLAPPGAFPNNTPATRSALVDALVYDTDDTDDASLLAILPGPQHNEAGAASGLSSADASNQRCPDGAGGPLDVSAYAQSTPSPGLSNVCIVCGDGIVDASERCDDGANNGAPGGCCLGNCQPRAAGVGCGAAPSEICDARDTCDGSGACVDNVEPADVVCRPEAPGGCDVEETCDGVSPTCPADAFADSRVECRAAAGDCDLAESCDGVSAACPADRFVARNTECRRSAGVCDVSEVCTGSDPRCPPDAVSDRSVECRASAGDCDVSEMCDGAGVDCPADAVASSSVVCRASAGGCDVEETCDGARVDCPADAVVAASTECRPSAGDCDVPETCDGSDPRCPPDALAGSSVECRASAGDCDVPETCDGARVDCPADAVADTTVECRASAGDCDVPETCDGARVDCPADAVADATVECRASAGDCDVPESCDGARVDCPADGFADTSVECRAAAGECDVAESCDGAGPGCPRDGFLGATVECRASAGTCDAAEACDGASATCPADVGVADGTPCADGTTCNGDETCQAGICAMGAAPVCDDGNLCTADACAEPAGCESTAIVGCCNIDDDCDDANVCTVDTCSGAGGTCGASPISGCCLADADCDDANACTANTCDLSTNTCALAAVPGCCEADTDCDDANACTTDSCTVATGECVNAEVGGCCLADGDCDDGNTCTLDACGADLMCTNDALAGCCVADADCDDGDPCTTDACDAATATCSSEAVPGCGETDAGVFDDGGVPLADAAIADDAAIGDDAGARADGSVATDGGALGDGGSTGEVEGGCGCRAAGAPSGGSTAWPLAALALVLRRRRRG